MQKHTGQRWPSCLLSVPFSSAAIIDIHQVIT